MLDRYADAARHALGEVAATQGEALEEAARLVADSGTVQVRPPAPTSADPSGGEPAPEGDLP
jgi:hypothetical protein